NACSSGRKGFPAWPRSSRESIYFLIVDRFNNRLAAPRHTPFDDPQFAGFQGGTFRGVAAQVPYLAELGAGAIWISPALRNLVLYSNNSAPAPPQPVVTRGAGSVNVAEVDGSAGTGPLNAIHVTLGPMEVQILGR